MLVESDLVYTVFLFFAISFLRNSLFVENLAFFKIRRHQIGLSWLLCCLLLLVFVVFILNFNSINLQRLIDCDVLGMAL